MKVDSGRKWKVSGKKICDYYQNGSKWDYRPLFILSNFPFWVFDYIFLKILVVCIRAEKFKVTRKIKTYIANQN
jgi:hypothetical protein